MSYNYKTQREELFTEEGVEHLREVERQVNCLLKEAGAFTFNKISIAGASWDTMAALDYLCEKGKLVKAHRENGKDCWSQFQVYTSPKKDNI